MSVGTQVIGLHVQVFLLPFRHLVNHRRGAAHAHLQFTLFPSLADLEHHPFRNLCQEVKSHTLSPFIGRVSLHPGEEQGGVGHPDLKDWNDGHFEVIRGKIPTILPYSIYKGFL